MRSDIEKQSHWTTAAEQKLRHVKPHAARHGDESQPHARVEWLIDNHRAYDALLSAVRDARESILISQLAFDSDCVALKPAGQECEGSSVLGAILEVSTAKHVNVDILLNTTLLLDTAKPLRRWMAKSGHDCSRVRVRGISRFPQLLHAKMVIVDGARGFLMGSPFVNGYWDESHHAPVDLRRPRRELGGRPVHDISVAVEGEVVQQLATVFAELWNAADGRGPEPWNAADDWGTQPSAATARRVPARTQAEGPLRLVTTLPSKLRNPKDEGSVATLEALLDGIAQASELIYIEHQYLSSRPVVAALRDALARHPDLEIVMFLNQNPDVTAYRGWQNARLTESGMLDHPRVGLFTLWSAGAGREQASVSINQVFVHSKVVIVDGRWAMVGSANLDGVSLDSYGSDFSSALLRRTFRDVRNVDVGLVFRDDAYASASQGSVRELRNRLWTEHLGQGANIDSRPEAGWLSAWRGRAAENVAALNSVSRKPACGSFLLPYSVQPTPRRQLKDIGITAPIDLQYEPSWLEVHCSPAWVRNMFL